MGHSEGGVLSEGSVPVCGGVCVCLNWSCDHDAMRSPADRSDCLMSFSPETSEESD